MKQTVKIKDITNDELIALMVEALNDGVTADSLKEEFAAYKLNGKTISKKTLELHVKKAAEIFSESAVKQLIAPLYF